MNVAPIQFPPALLTRELAAYYISGSLRDIDELRARGQLTAVGDQKRVKFRRTDLDAWIARLPERSAAEYAAPSGARIVGQ